MQFETGGGYVVENGTKGTKIINPIIAMTIAIAFLSNFLLFAYFNESSNNSNQFVLCVIPAL